MNPLEMGGSATFTVPRKRLNGMDLAQLLHAAQDLRFLLGRGYPQLASLTLVGNRYNLTYDARQLLHRGVFDPVLAARRRSKLCLVRDLTGQPLALDGHNALITVECGLSGLPLIAADDGFIRDIGQISHRYKPSAITDRALILISRFLADGDVGPVMVWYDAPMSRSGELAKHTRQILQEYGLLGEVEAVLQPENKLMAFQGVIGTSDTQLIDQATAVVDVAGEIIRRLPRVNLITLGENGS